MSCSYIHQYLKFSLMLSSSTTCSRHLNADLSIKPNANEVWSYKLMVLDWKDSMLMFMFEKKFKNQRAQSVLEYSGQILMVILRCKHTTLPPCVFQTCRTERPKDRD